MNSYELNNIKLEKKVKELENKVYSLERTIRRDKKDQWQIIKEIMDKMSKE